MAFIYRLEQEDGDTSSWSAAPATAEPTADSPQDDRTRGDARKAARDIDAHDHVTEAGATLRAAPEPVNGRWNLRGRGQSKPSGWSGVSFLAPHSMPTWPSS